MLLLAHLLHILDAYKRCKGNADSAYGAIAPAAGTGGDDAYVAESVTAAGQNLVVVALVLLQADRTTGRVPLSR